VLILGSLSEVTPPHADSDVLQARTHSAGKAAHSAAPAKGPAEGSQGAPGPDQGAAPGELQASAGATWGWNLTLRRGRPSGLVRPQPEPQPSAGPLRAPGLPLGAHVPRARERWLPSPRPQRAIPLEDSSSCVRRAKRPWDASHQQWPGNQRGPTGSDGGQERGRGREPSREEWCSDSRRDPPGKHPGVSLPVHTCGRCAQQSARRASHRNAA